MTTSLGSTATVSLTTAFIDLSTFDEIECWLYGGKSVNRFRKVIRKAAWFTVIAAQLNKCGTTGDFNSEMQAMFSRAGDYIRDVWLRVELPEVIPNPGFQARWTRNVGHNLIDEAYLQFNDLTVNKLTSYHIDFLSAFLVTEGKWNGYSNMIGNVNVLTDPYEEYALFPQAITPNNPQAVPPIVGTSVRLPRYAINLPLPFYFTRDHHDAIIQAACPFNDVRLTIKFRAWEDLLIIDRIPDWVDDGAGNNTAPAIIPAAPGINPAEALRNTNLRLTNCQVWAHYAVIPNGDREKISEEGNIDTIIEQIQTIPPTTFNPANQRQRGVDLRFAHSIRAIFFAMRNTTIRNEWSNYSTHVPRGVTGTPGIIWRPVGATNPVGRAVLTYENVDRVNMSSDYFTLVSPFYSANRIPNEIGYHLLSYCNRLDTLQPDGSTNFARLASVNLNIEASEVAEAQAAALDAVVRDPWDPAFHTMEARFDIIITASSLSVLRFSSGSVGFPVL